MKTRKKSNVEDGNMIEENNNKNKSLTKTNKEENINISNESNDIYLEISYLRGEIKLLNDILKEKDIVIKEKDEKIQLLLEQKLYYEDNYNFLCSNIEEKDTIMNSLSEINCQLKEIYSNKVITPTYAEKLKSTTTPKLILKPKIDQASNTTKSDLVSNISINQLKIGINSIKTTRKGTIEITCNNQQHIEKLSTEINKRMTNKYEILPQIQKQPKIKIPGLKICEEVGVQDLEKTIIQQNEFDPEDLFKIENKIYNTVKKTYTLYCEVNGKLFNKLMSKNVKKIFVLWQNLHFYDNNHIKPCLHCCRFGHSTKKCLNPPTCYKCSGNHIAQNCKEEKHICNNCQYYNNKYKQTINTNHMATDKNCSTYIYFQKQYLQQINFQ